ncbi:NADPH-dependent oxidoreductase [Pediococcus acidilactici]|uniref:NADPH-dependent oxidoreductase n=1 Tax=Pediococcus acidilactici TaxID=1254 RepID=UPI00132C558B|nr:NADPH-dependent oxidoreductase [Pediococcus acidilactici]KAF0338723.1 NADPH-dependent oxidoreductase [Pediococcus acidilactici]KAF0341192.1 NADPH-dependent oxidoreductase [Pediococcus acidilactici]KAF0350806.1 NADPH-dependent oxidoreductase [Pediococcus acidilactici]KAF0381045.1 NADPH-dependent oxidoreductase [Pediococcus acidilactici]KAF0391883.1 NADPH-dependent oxidoreductase [Pediococcus acidilactici]
MEDVIELMKKHTSVRNFADTSLTDEVKEQLIIAAHAGASSNFVQATSIIDVTDPSIRGQLAEISKSAAYVKQSGAFFVFVADLYRQSQILQQQGLDLAGIKNMEALTVAIVDTAIAGENLAVAAESLDLGICYIGGIRNDLTTVRDLINLPKFTVPLFGITVGKPTRKNAVKPRMPLHNNTFKNGYDRQAAQDMSEYQKITQAYYANRSSHAQETDWIRKMTDFFAEPRRTDVAPFLLEQGFTLN